MEHNKKMVWLFATKK